jgi:hypothetical protein
MVGLVLERVRKRGLDKSEEYSDISAMTHADLIAALGGGTTVARLMTEETGANIDREAVYKWQRNGVPLKWRFPLAKVAKRKRASLPSGFLPGTMQ